MTPAEKLLKKLYHTDPQSFHHTEWLLHTDLDILENLVDALRSTSDEEKQRINFKKYQLTKEYAKEAEVLSKLREELQQISEVDIGYGFCAQIEPSSLQVTCSGPSLILEEISETIVSFTFTIMYEGIEFHEEQIRKPYADTDTLYGYIESCLGHKLIEKLRISENAISRLVSPDETDGAYLSKLYGALRNLRDKYGMHMKGISQTLLVQLATTLRESVLPGDVINNRMYEFFVENMEDFSTWMYMEHEGFVISHKGKQNNPPIVFVRISENQWIRVAHKHASILQRKQLMKHIIQS